MCMDGWDWVEARVYSEVAFLFRWFVSITQPSPVKDVRKWNFPTSWKAKPTSSALDGCSGLPQKRCRATSRSAKSAMRGGMDVIGKGQTHLRTRDTRYRATSLLERFNRELRAREGMGTVWTVHNLLVVLQLWGVLT